MNYVYGQYEFNKQRFAAEQITVIVPKKIFTLWKSQNKTIVIEWWIITSNVEDLSRISS